MAVTVSTDITHLILAKVVESLIIAYQYDDAVAPGFCRYKSIEGEATATASFPRLTKNAVGSVATETTSLTPTTMATSTVDISVARTGIAREIAETALEDNILGRALYTDELVQDAARLYGEQIETDVTALFPSITASVGSTTVALTIATMVAAFASQRANKARGAQVVHLHDLGIKQLQTAQAAATATPWATFFSPNADSTQFGGYFMGAPVWSSAKNPTANASADRVGCVWTQGAVAPKYCAFAFVMKRAPSSLNQSDVLQDANIWASFMRSGQGIVANNFATKIIHANS